MEKKEMYSKLESFLKATIKSILVAFIYTFIICLIIYILFAPKISNLFSYIDLISVEENKEIQMNVIFNKEKKKLDSYPGYGSRYASLEIESVNINMPVYYGDDLSILRYGIGHDPSSYFPGEGGSILYMGHNNYGMLHDLPNVKIKDIIKVKTVYGEFNYIVYDTKIIKETDFDKVPIKDDEEILMLYTCYPIYSVVRKNERYVIYARYVSEENI